MTKDFRFGINLLASPSRKAWQDTARQVEDAGYDVLLVPDHLGLPAVFPALVSAAEVTTRPRLGTFVLNAGFYKPALLARDVAGTDQLTDGRFELGLGAGYVQEEFEAAELPFPSPKGRVDHLEHTVTEVRRFLADPEHQPQPAQQPIPLMIAGRGDRVLRMAARHADIVGIAGAQTATKAGETDTLAEHIDLLRKTAGDRFPDLELNLLITTVHLDGSGEPDLSMPRRFYPELSDAELLDLPGVLHGSPQGIADTLQQYRDTYGLTYFTVLQPYLADFAKVIDHIR